MTDYQSHIGAYGWFWNSNYAHPVFARLESVTEDEKFVSSGKTEYDGFSPADQFPPFYNYCFPAGKTLGYVDAPPYPPACGRTYIVWNNDGNAPKLLWCVTWWPEPARFSARRDDVEGKAFDNWQVYEGKIPDTIL